MLPFNQYQKKSSFQKRGKAISILFRVPLLLNLATDTKIHRNMQITRYLDDSRQPQQGQGNRSLLVEEQRGGIRTA